MRNVLIIFSLLVLVGCSGSSSNTCSPNGDLEVTTEQRFVSTDGSDANATKTYAQSNPTSSGNFYGYRHVKMKNGRELSGYFDGSEQNKNIDPITIDWQARQLLSRDSAIPFWSVTSDAPRVNLNLGGQTFLFEFAVSAQEMKQINSQVSGKSDNGVTLCAVDKISMYLAKSDQNPNDVVLMTKVKLGIMVANPPANE